MDGAADIDRNCDLRVTPESAERGDHQYFAVTLQLGGDKAFTLVMPMSWRHVAPAGVIDLDEGPAPLGAARGVHGGPARDADGGEHWGATREPEGLADRVLRGLRVGYPLERCWAHGPPDQAKWGVAQRKWAGRRHSRVSAS